MATIPLLVLVLSLLSVDSIKIESIPPTGTPPSKRQRSSIAYDKSSSSVFIYGGFEDMSEYYEDIWRFDLVSNTWEELISPSRLTPGPRVSSFMHVLEESRSILLFGGNTQRGPISDLWLLDIDNIMVTFIQWEPVVTKGPKPSASAYSGAVAYKYNEKTYIATFGGIGRKDTHNNLNILDLETYTWSLEPKTGFWPTGAYDCQLHYHNGALYLYGGRSSLNATFKDIYRYDLELKQWNILNITGRPSPRINGVNSYLNNGYLYILFGFNVDYFRYMHEVLRLDLSRPEGGFETLYDPLAGNMNRYYFACGGSVEDSKMFIFGGVSEFGHQNNLVQVDFIENIPKLTQLSSDAEVPTARLNHAMQAHSGSLYIFGGRKADETHIIDMWRYDLQLRTWTPFSVNSKQPLGREQFAHTRDGDIIFIFGGEGDDGLLDDMHFFNLNTGVWEEIQAVSKTKPSARKGACMSINKESILIFGGKTLAGYNNELWKFELGSREFSNLQDQGTKPPLLAYSRCKTYIEEDGNVMFYLYYGETTGNTALSNVYSYNLRTNTWTAIRRRPFDYTARSGIAVEYQGNYMIAAGGIQHGYKATNEVLEINMATGNYTLLGRLPKRSYSAASVYFENKLYIHGGGYSFEALSIPEVPVHDFYVLDLSQNCDPVLQHCGWKCSRGTYAIDGKCEWCPLGSFNEEEGAASCELCKSGYYENSLAADSYTKCKPCDMGSFNSLPGQAYCLDCPSNKDCPVSSTYPVDLDFKLEYTSSQPKIYENSIEQVDFNNHIIGLAIGMCFLAMFVLMFLIKNASKHLKNIDIYTDRHNYEIDTPLYQRKTIIGGIFSLFAFAIVIGVIASSVNSYVEDNIAETKVLVPMVALEEKFDNYKAKQMIFEFRFLNYGDDCKFGDSCTEDLIISSLNLEGKLKKTTCQRIQSDCLIRIEYENSELINSGSVTVDLTESLSFATEIVMNVTISSSIPNEYSSITSYIDNPSDTIFRGLDPSIFYLTMTPSVFVSEVEDWVSEETGYHVSISKSPQKGSLIDIDEIPITKNLKATINLDKNQSVLMTSRYQVQSYYLFLASLAGSVLGIIGALGYFMQKAESFYINKYLKISKASKQDSHLKKRKIINNCFALEDKKAFQSIEIASEKDEPHYNSINSIYISGNLSNEQLEPQVEGKYYIDPESSLSEMVRSGITLLHDTSSLPLTNRSRAKQCRRTRIVPST